MNRTVAAFALAPAVAAAIFSSAAGPSVAFTLSYAVSYICGIPVFLILRKKRCEKHRCYALAGAIFGAAYVITPAILSLNVEGFIAAGLMAVVGALVALAFSLIRGNERHIA